MVYICSEILLSHKKERIWVSPKEVGESRVHYTEWSKKDGTDETICRATVETDIEKKIMDSGRWAKKEMVGGILPYVK